MEGWLIGGAVVLGIVVGGVGAIVGVGLWLSNRLWP